MQNEKHNLFQIEIKFFFEDLNVFVVAFNISFLTDLKIYVDQMSFNPIPVQKLYTKALDSLKKTR